MMKKELLLVFIISFLSLSINSQNIVTEDQTGYSYDNGCYTVSLGKAPFSLSASVGGRDLFLIDAIAVHDKFVTPEVVTGTITSNQLAIVLKVSGVYYNLGLCFNERTIDLLLETANRSVTEKLGLRMSTSASGHWYGGAVVKGHNWPLEQSSFEVDPFIATSNQASPVWYTSSGAGIFSRTYNLMGYSFNKPEKGFFDLYSKKSCDFTLCIAAGKNIREAWSILSEIVGKPSTVPAKYFFAWPQFNTWIEFFSEVNQKGIIRYVQEIKSNGFPYKLFIIDDKWTVYYGDTRFDPVKFPDPKGLVSYLHDNGFKVALWMTPFIQKSSANFAYALEHKYLIMNPDGTEPYFSKWWNGTDAIVDLSNPEAYSWFLGLLKGMQTEYGFDGFKLDAGDAEYLANPFSSYGKVTSSGYADLFASLGRHFEANELRVSWLSQQMGLIQRLRDKGPNWSETDGINSLIPHALTSSMIGFVYTCPDLIGGGLDQGYKEKGYKFDEELFVRWTQASALMPMMQYSLAPWKLSKASTAICRKYSELHVSLGDYIYELATRSSIDGTPIVRPLFFEFPDDEKTYLVKDEFMLGDRFLVAPLLQKGAVSRKVYLPAGTWIDYNTGRIITGGKEAEYPAPLDVLPLFVRVND